MLTFIAVVGGAVLLVALIALVYFSGSRSKADETGRRTEAAAHSGPKPPRAEGRDD